MRNLLSNFVRVTFALLGSACILAAHPMGNFSVNHYVRIEVGQPATNVLFVLDLAELPSFELMQRWGLQASSPRADLQRKAIAEARIWVRQLQFSANGKRVTPIYERGELVLADGAGGLPVMRINSHLKLAAEPGTLAYSDQTYPDRTAGWKEVVVVARGGALLEKSSASTTERSEALAAYPQDPSVSPPQDLTATVQWKGAPGAAPVVVSEAAKPVERVPADRVPADPVSADPVPAQAPALAAQAQPAPAATPTASTVAEPNSMGQVRRGDFLSKALQGREIGWGLGLICVAVSFWFGALHALEPGHGKTMVAAYLVGERGTPKHAILLGGMVTFTHTVSVFVLGLLTMFLSQYIMPDVISKWLGVISGLTIVWIGGLLLYRRSRSLAKAAHVRAPEETAPRRSHSHDHGRTFHVHTDRVHTHGPAVASHSHSHGGMTHTHDGNTHSHVIEGEISMKSLIALGASGGLVPCPSALVLLLAAVSVGRIGFGLLLLVSFSLGLALVLMATGLIVLYAKRFFPERKDNTPNPFFKIMPVVSAAVILLIGVVLTGNALGLIPVVRFFG